MKRRVAPVTKLPQGSLDKKSNWVQAQARYGWVMQSLLHFDIDVCLDPLLKESTGLAVPLWFDKTRLRPINSLTPKSVPAGTKLVLFGRYVLNIYVGIVQYFLRTTKLSAPKSTYRHNAQIGEHCTILTSAKNIRF